MYLKLNKSNQVFPLVSKRNLGRWLSDSKCLPICDFIAPGVGVLAAALSKLYVSEPLIDCTDIHVKCRPVVGGGGGSYNNIL